MSFLSKVNDLPTKQTGQRIVIAGVEKIGKTTLVLNAPERLFVPLEIGFLNNTPNKTQIIQTYDDFNALIDEIISECQKGKFKFKTLAIDSFTAFERFCHDKTVQSDAGWKKGNPKGLTMASALGGYGKAYQYANELFVAILNKLDQLVIYGGINIVATCHVFAGKVIDPAYGEYDTWDLLLHSPKDNKSYGKREIVTQWADLIGFLHEPLFVTKGGEHLQQGVSSNKGRILGIERTPGYVAGNRYGIKGELSIPKDQCWNYLAHAIYQASGIDIYNKQGM